ncbi:MAG: hypothetical protein Q9227_001807 [Pyrenula ochraceoflavens]
MASDSATEAMPNRGIGYLSQLERVLNSLSASSKPYSSGMASNTRSCVEAMKQHLSTTSNIRPLLYGIIFLLIAVYLTRQTISKHVALKRQRAASPTAPGLEKGAPSSSSAVSKLKPTSRPPGQWTPSSFRRPAATPYPNWSVHDTPPLPYRPFRYGPKYFVTMGLRSMKWDEWIELDNQYLRFHADKARRIATRGSKCCMTAPEALPAAHELLEELTDYLPQRYPSLFRRTATGIDNLLTGESFNTTDLPLAEDPITICARLVQDDLALMLERPDGQYYLLSGAILLAGFWRLTDKFGMPLSEIHTSGSVPQFRSKLEKGMLNFFRRLRPEEPVLRNNYFLQVDDDLAWSHSIGDEDSDSVSWSTAQKNKAIEHHYFRSERQSLRRLPRTGAVVFTIRTYFVPVTELAEEEYVPGRLASAVRSWGEDVAKYKGRERYGEVLLEFLDRKHAEQVERGLVLGREEEEEKKGKGYPY